MIYMHMYNIIVMAMQVSEGRGGEIQLGVG